VSFTAVNSNTKLEIVQSLAKWKRHALHKYNCSGIYTDMNAIRPFEEQDNIHSLYVDQWDWEKIITKEDRTQDFLKDTVNKIYNALLETCDIVTKQFPKLTYDLPENITFITTSELEDLYPNLSRKERENEITKKYKAVFLIGIGHPLKDNLPHDNRSADYDDWNLNGDILLWYEPLNIAFEISSMGIRVSKDELLKQLEYKNEMHKLEYTYHQNIINNVLPLTIGGGIGQSRICMFFLKKVHIGEVQASYWTNDDILEFKKYNIHLL
jgi:aspartate--ammonia ligase